LIRQSNMRLVANALPLSDPVPEIPTGKFKADLFLAKPGSPAAKLSRGFKAKGTGALMRYAPPGMLALFVWNTSVAIEGTLESYNGQDLDSKLKGGVAILYGASNLLYWLGHITEA